MVYSLICEHMCKFWNTFLFLFDNYKENEGSPTEYFATKNLPRLIDGLLTCFTRGLSPVTGRFPPLSSCLLFILSFDLYPLDDDLVEVSVKFLWLTFFTLSFELFLSCHDVGCVCRVECSILRLLLPSEPLLTSEEARLRRPPLMKPK